MIFFNSFIYFLDYYSDDNYYDPYQNSVEYYEQPFYEGNEGPIIIEGTKNVYLLFFFCLFNFIFFS